MSITSKNLYHGPRIAGARSPSIDRIVGQFDRDLMTKDDDLEVFEVRRLEPQTHQLQHAVDQNAKSCQEDSDTSSTQRKKAAILRRRNKNTSHHTAFKASI